MATNPIDLMAPEVDKVVSNETSTEAVLAEATEKKLKQIVVIGVDSEGKPFCASSFTSVRRMRGLMRILDKAIRAHEARNLT